MNESEWQTRKQRIDARLRSSNSAWKIIRYREGFDFSALDCHAVEELPTVNGPTEDVWIFDARSNVPGITKKDRPLTAQPFAEFEKCYGKDPNVLSRRTATGQVSRFRKFHVSEIKERGCKLDVTWLKDDSLEDADELPEPQDLAAEASRSWRQWWMICGRLWRSWKRKRV